MTLDELIEALTDLRTSEDCGEHSVYFQEIKNGVTYANKFEVSIGDPADGKVVWLWATTQHGPEWMEC